MAIESLASAAPSGLNNKQVSILKDASSCNDVGYAIHNISDAKAGST